MHLSSERLIVRIEHEEEIITLLNLPSSPSTVETKKVYERIQDLRILDVIDLVSQLELMREVYRHTRTTPYQARHNVSQQ